MRRGRVHSGETRAAASYALIVALALALGGCFGETFQRGYVLPEGALEQIRLGASQEQVLIVLGTPSTVATVSGEAFYYISQRAERAISFMPAKITDQRVIAIYFDKDRRVATGRLLRHQGRQGVRLHQPHDADGRRGHQFHQGAVPKPWQRPHRPAVLSRSARICNRASSSDRNNQTIQSRMLDCCGTAPFFDARAARQGMRRLSQCAKIASSNSATMLVILIIGLTAGPAVSL